MYVSYEGDKKALFLFHCGLLLFCMTDDDGDWRGQIRLFPSFPLKCLIFSLLSLSFTSFSLSSPPKGAYWFWIWQGPDLTPAASGPATRLVLDVWADHRLSICFLTSGLTNQVQFWHGQACLWGCVSGSPSPDFGTCPWPVGGAIINLVTGFTFHDEIIHFLFVLDDQIFLEVGWTIKVSKWCTKKCA